MNSFDFILPFLRPIQRLILDDEVSEVMVNGDGRVFVERDGVIGEEAIEIRERFMQAAVRNIARVLGDEIDERHPLLNSRLPDGSRVAAAIPPASVGGTVLDIRKFRSRRFTAQELVDRGMLTPEMLDWLVNVIRVERGTILISGGTGTGKTSLLNALAGYLPPEDRVVLIEDTAEIVLEARNLVRLEARRAQPDASEVSIRDLLRHTLRLRPDRIILGEVRGAEAFDLLQALNTGHTGTLSTIHANTALLAISRLRTCIAMAGFEIPDLAIARSIGEVVGVVVHIDRRAGRRTVTEMLRIRDYDTARQEYRVSDWREDVRTQNAVSAIS
jgi:pilus assembly protein CpaF